MTAEELRAALRCDRPSCSCHGARGPVHCPGHDDAHPSFDVDEKDGRVLVYCQSRHCPQEQIIEALRARGLWEGKPPAPVLSRLRRGVLEGPINDAARFIERYVVMPSDAATTATALWVAHTHAISAFDVTPFLIVLSAVMRSGKTRLLEVLELLTPRAWRVVQPSEAVLFRKIAKDRPVLLLDEADAIFNPKNNGAEPLRAVLNAGSRRGATVPRCVPEGKKIELRDFDVFCPKGIAAIGRLPLTVEDRGLIVRLNRATPAEQRRIRRLRFKEAEAEAAPIREALSRWAEAALPKLRESRPALPEELDGRAADAWEPLMAIGEQAGDGWAVMAWQAALVLSTGAAREDDSLRVRLLADIRRVFEERAADRLATADLIEALAEDEASPWGDYYGRRLTPQALARLLRPFGIRPEQWRDGDRTGIRGYTRGSFTDAFARYVALEPLQPLHVSQDAGFSHFDEPLHPPLVAGVENGGNTDGACIVAGVAGTNPPEGAEEDLGTLFSADPGQQVPDDEALPPLVEAARRLFNGEIISNRPMPALFPPADGRQAPDDEPLATPEDLEKGGGAGQACLRVGESLAWGPGPYAPGISIDPGKIAWLTFIRATPAEELRRAFEGLAAVLDDRARRGVGGVPQ